MDWRPETRSSRHTLTRRGLFPVGWKIVRSWCIRSDIRDETFQETKSNKNKTMKLKHTFLTAILTVTLAVSHGARGDDQANIVETAVAADDFNTLVAAVQAADLAETLSGPGPFTVFAPTDAAFAALPEGTVESLLQPENRDQLVAVLTYHVVPGKILSTDIQPGNVETVNGEAVTISVEDGTVKVDEATVVAADVEASNGVIHVIDAVILPSGD